ncbi:MAG: LysO family transporter, partial [Thermoplasmata archaeon]
MEFDPFLYVALGAGILLGLLWRPTTPWIPRATQASVAVLLFFLGASIAPLGVGRLAPSIGIGVGLAALTLGLTFGVALLLPKPTERGGQAPPALPRERIPFSAILLGALALGYVLGTAVPFPTTGPITASLYALLILVGLGLRWTGQSLRRWWVPLLAAVAGALGAGAVYALAAGVSPAVALATTLAFGWYSLDGPIVAASAGAALGLV